jgi:hypothetical protein
VGGSESEKRLLRIEGIYQEASKFPWLRDYKPKWLQEQSSSIRQDLGRYNIAPGCRIYVLEMCTSPKDRQVTFLRVICKGWARWLTTVIPASKEV